MSLYLSSLTLNAAPSARALIQLLNPENANAAADAHHRLIWTAFSDAKDRNRDFLWRYDGENRFYTLSARPPRPGDLFGEPAIKTFEPNLTIGDRLDFVLRANATKVSKQAGGKRVRYPRFRLPAHDHLLRGHGAEHGCRVEIAPKAMHKRHVVADAGIGRRPQRQARPHRKPQNADALAVNLRPFPQVK